MHDVPTGSTTPQDAQLPWLATALDREAMSRHFVRCVLPTFSPSEPGRFSLHDCDIDHVRYRPGRNCAIAYRLQVLDTLTHEQHDLRFNGRMYPPDGGATRHARAARQDLQRPPLGPPLHWIAPLDMVLWAFPNERKLAGLGSVLDDARLGTAVLPEVIAAGWGNDWRLGRFRSDIIHYVPEHALTLRVQATLRHAGTGEQRPVALYGKCYHDDQGERSLQVLRSLADQGGALRTPAPVCYQPGLRLLWQEALPGMPLADLLHTDCAVPALMRQAGEQIAALHGARTVVARTLGYEQLVARIATVEPVLAAQLHCRSSLVHSAAALLRAHQPINSYTPVLLHGDLHTRNILAGSGGLGLIDLDGCTMGPAAWDLGSFVAALIASGIADGDTGRARRQAQWLLEGYGAGQWDASAHQALDWSVACALVIERAWRSVSRMKAGRLSLLAPLLEAALRSLRQGWREAAQ